MTRAVLAVVALAWAALGCSRTPVLEQVEPPRALTDRTTRIVIVGRYLDRAVAEQAGRLVPEPWQVRLGGRPVEKVVWRSPSRIEAEVPEGMPPGAHDVVVRVTGRPEGRLARGLTLVRPAPPRIDRVEPDSVTLEGGPVVFHGAGLHYGTRVWVDGAESRVRWLDDTALSVDVPRTLQGTGAARVEIVTPVGRIDSRGLLRYRARPPVAR